MMGSIYTPYGNLTQEIILPFQFSHLSFTDSPVFGIDKVAFQFVPFSNIFAPEG